MMVYPSEIILYYEGRIPSVNKWLRPGLRTIIKNRRPVKIPYIYTMKSYSSAKNDMTTSFKYQCPIKIKGLVDIIYYYKANRVTDSDNFQKCVQDAIEDAGIISDDKMIRNIKVFRYYDKKASLLIHIKKAEDNNPAWPTGDIYDSLEVNND